MSRDSVLFAPPSMMPASGIRADMQLAALEEASNAISTSTNRSDLSRTVDNLRSILGLEHMVYHAIRLHADASRAPYLLLYYDKQWVDRYVDRNYFMLDPVVIRGATQVAPIDWAHIKTSRTQPLFSEADRYGVGRQGVTIPIRGPGGERALFTITSNASDSDWERFRSNTIRTFTEIGQYLHERVATIEGVRNLSAPNLSRREQQCLQMMAHGCLPKDIAYTLHLSPSAVRLYLNSAKFKLTSVTLYQAVARAVALKIVST